MLRLTMLRLTLLRLTLLRLTMLRLTMLRLTLLRLTLLRLTMLRLTLLRLTLLPVTLLRRTLIFLAHGRTLVGIPFALLGFEFCLHGLKEIFACASRALHELLPDAFEALAALVGFLVPEASLGCLANPGLALAAHGLNFCFCRIHGPIFRAGIHSWLACLIRVALRGTAGFTCGKCARSHQARGNDHTDKQLLHKLSFQRKPPEPSSSGKG
jgi:hypothetical protein